MQRVRDVVRKFMLPIALLAGAAWVFAFLYMFIALPRHGLGYLMLLVLGGAVMAVPWIIMGLGVIQRMHEASVEAGKDESHDNHRPA